MKISLNWLKEFIDLPESTDKIEGWLTGTGLEVEGVDPYEEIEGGLEGIVIGEVLTCERHPNADKLSVTTVDIGKDAPSPIVCGAPNVTAGQKVVVATVGSTLFPVGGESFKIKKAKIRGEVSEGMICAEDEIGIGNSHDGIMVLDTDLPNGTPAREYFQPETDEVVEIGLTPNRADAASHFGVARDLKALLDRPVTLPESKDLVSNGIRTIEVEVLNTTACPRYTGVTITDITVAPSPSWLQNRLKAIGLVPINNVVDITNYILHGLGQPLHAFDADEITGGKIIVDTLDEGATFITLDEKERKLYKEDLMICDGDRNGMCIGGVFGGIKSGVKDSTTAIFLESAYFSPDYIRRSAQRHQLKTDASFRFERGTDPNGTLDALKVAANLIVDICGGKISSDIVDIYPEPVSDFAIDVKFKNIHRLIGKHLDHDFIIKTLNLLDIKTDKLTEDGFTAIVPPYRVDVTRE
ncbi:MAG: phenylalanine--tRNA ligase subunit beta, partial [Bacteroidota bacterium]